MRSRLQDQARRHAAAAAAALAARRDEPPAPGDLYAFAATAEHDVLWAVLALRDERGLVVAADLEREVGSADVATASGSPFGAAVLRCAFGAWLVPAAFAAGRRVGVLEAADLEAARERRRQVERGVLTAPTAQREVDGESGYRDRLAVLAAAQAALATGVAGASLADERGDVTPFDAADLLRLPGIDAATGEPELAPFALAAAAAWARAEAVDPHVLGLLTSVHQRASQPHLGPAEEAADLATAGWALVLHADEDPAVRAALEPLIEHRRRQGARVRVLEVRDGEDWREWLARHGVGADEDRPERVPRHLLLAGSPERIPWDFQTLLGVGRAVGRVAFDEPGAYRRYAESVVRAETTPAANGREALVFAPRRPHEAFVRRLVGDRDARLLTAAAATRRGLKEALRRPTPPALFVGAGPGLSWPVGHPQQAAMQGALLGGDWPGNGRVLREHFFAAADLPSDAHLHGSFALFLASYGAGTPARDPVLQAPGGGRQEVAPRPFVARLAQALLAHPAGGALAVVGLVDRAWDVSLGAAGDAGGAEPLAAMVGALLTGRPVGAAVRELNRRHAARATELAGLLRKAGFGGRIDEGTLARAWLERNHLRGFVVLGDPAARMPGRAATASPMFS